MAEIRQIQMNIKQESANELFINYLKTGKDCDFLHFRNKLHYMMTKLFFGKSWFRENPVFDFDDIFNGALLKLVEKREKWNKKKGKITTYFKAIFQNHLTDIIRREAKAENFRAPLPENWEVNLRNVFGEEVTVWQKLNKGSVKGVKDWRKVVEWFEDFENDLQNN